MAGRETPISVMFATLKSLKISNKDAAFLLFDKEKSFGGEPIIDRINERTFLNRIVHSDPCMISPTYFSDLSQAAQTICSKVSNNSQLRMSFQEIPVFLSEKPMESMRNALSIYGLDAAYFRNLMQSAIDIKGISAADRASLMMLIFIATGCYGDPASAMKEADRFIDHISAPGFKTSVPVSIDLGGRKSESSESVPEKDAIDKLGLVRVIDGAMDLSNTHQLAGDGIPNIIGSLASEKHSINDVGPLVSRRHLKIYQKPDGSWWAQGLGSTNGTTIIKGSDKSEIVLEAPYTDQPASSSLKKDLKDDIYPDSSEHLSIRILPGDALNLAGTTLFLVLKIR